MTTQKYGGFSDRYQYEANNPNAVCNWARPSVSVSAYVTDPVTQATTILNNGNGIINTQPYLGGITRVDQYVQEDGNRWGGFLINATTTQNYIRTPTAINDFLPGGSRHSYTQFTAGASTQSPSLTSFVQNGPVEFARQRTDEQQIAYPANWTRQQWRGGQRLNLPIGPHQFVRGLYSSKNQYQFPVEQVRLKGFGAYSGFSVLVNLPNFCFFGLPRPRYMPNRSNLTWDNGQVTPWVTTRSTRGFGSLGGSVPTPIPTPPPSPCAVDAIKCKPVLIWDPIVNYKDSLYLHPVFNYIYPYSEYNALFPSNAYLFINYTDYTSNAVGSPRNDNRVLQFGYNNSAPNPYPFGRVTVSNFDHETVPYYLNVDSMITPSANLLDTDPTLGSIITIPRGGVYGITARIRFFISNPGITAIPTGPYDYFEAEVVLELQNSEAPTWLASPPGYADVTINGIGL